VKEGYKYFPCANEYKTEEEIAIGGEKEKWRVTKLSSEELGRTRAQTVELEVAKSLEELSAANDLESRRKEAAKVDAATSLFVLRDVEKEKGEALHFAREQEVVGQLKVVLGVASQYFATMHVMWIQARCLPRIQCRELPVRRGGVAKLRVVFQLRRGEELGFRRP
jgi:hypothetical protein